MKSLINIPLPTLLLIETASLTSYDSIAEIDCSFAQYGTYIKANRNYTGINILCHFDRTTLIFIRGYSVAWSIETLRVHENVLPLTPVSQPGLINADVEV